MHRGDHRHGQLRSRPTPRAARSSPGSSPCRARAGVGPPRLRLAGHRLEAPKSRPAQKARPSPESTTARSDAIARELRAGRDQRLEHRHVERVHLVGAIEAHVRDAARPAVRPRRDPTSRPPIRLVRACSAQPGRAQMIDLVEVLERPDEAGHADRRATAPPCRRPAPSRSGSTPRARPGCRAGA